METELSYLSKDLLRCINARRCMQASRPQKKPSTLQLGPNTKS